MGELQHLLLYVLADHPDSQTPLGSSPPTGRGSFIPSNGRGSTSAVGVEAASSGSSEGPGIPCKAVHFTPESFFSTLFTSSSQVAGGLLVYLRKHPYY